MIKISRSDHFKKDYQKLPQPIRQSANKQIVQLLMDHTHPSLHLEAIASYKGLFSIRVNQQYRISLSFEPEGTLMLRRILDHDDLYQSP